MKYSKMLVAIILLLLVTTTAVLAHTPYERRHAVTLWWVIFNQPGECVFNPGAVERCGPVDIFGQAYLDSVAAGAPDPGRIQPNLASGIAVVYATGGVTDKLGRIQLVASIYRTAAEGLNLGGQQIVDPMLLGRAFSNPGAEVHLVVRDHGKRDQFGNIAQITNFLEPHCSDPALGFVAGENLCKDIQFAIFAPDESGADAVFDIVDGALLSGSTAYLFRQGDMLQAIVKTRLRRDPNATTEDSDD